MFESIIKFFKKADKKEALKSSSKEAAKERLHLVLMQDRANVSADFLDLMRQEIIEVIKKYIDIDEKSMDVRLTNQANDDGTQGAPALYANIPILNIKKKERNAKKETEENNKNNEKNADDKLVEDKIEEAKKIEHEINSEEQTDSASKEKITNKESGNE